MATGDPVQQFVSVGGGSGTTISVPSGEGWAISDFGGGRDGDGNHELKANDGSNTSRAFGAGGGMQGKPTFADGTLDPLVRNNSCNTEQYAVVGMEIDSTVVIGDLTQVSSGGTAVVSIPAGETWVISDFGGGSQGDSNHRLQAHDGSNHSRHYGGGGKLKGRPVYEEGSLDVGLGNNSGNSEHYATVGRTV